MFTHIKLTNFTVFSQLDWPGHSAMNVIIGENDTGKSHLLKMLYVIGRGINNYQRQIDKRRPWLGYVYGKSSLVFLRNSPLASTVRRGNHDMIIEFDLDVNNSVNMQFSVKDNGEMQAATAGIEHIRESLDGMSSLGLTVFLPPKEILTAMQAIEATRKRLEIPGFDDTYLDLIEDFRVPLTYGTIEPGLFAVVDKVKSLLNGGEIVEKGLEFVFQRDQEEYSMSQTAEGFKKVGMLSRLILNRSLTKGSILLVDEPESNLHPRAIIALADMLFDLSLAGVQVYAATHSFYFLSRIEQRAREAKTEPVSLLNLHRSSKGVTATFHDLREGMPDNPILQQSAYLLNEAIRLDWES